MGVSREVGQLEGLPLDRCERLQRPMNPLRIEPFDDGLRCGVVGDVLVAGAVSLVAVTGCLRRPDPVDGLAVSDGEHPRESCTLARVEPCAVPPDLEEDLLGDFL